jgi:hypothetical protein
MDSPSPYLPPAIPPPPPGPGEPAAIKVFGIIHLVFAGLGLISGLWTIASPFVTPMFLPKNDPSFQLQMRLQEELRGFSIGSAIISLGLAVLLLISGIKLVRSQPGGIKWSAIYSWTSVGAKLVMLVVSVVWIIPQTRATMHKLLETQGAKAGPGADKVLAFMEPMMATSMVVSPLIACIYPLLALFFLSRRNVKAWMAARSQGAA